MAIVTTYICDISGKQGNEEDFVSIKIESTTTAKMKVGGFVSSYDKIIIMKLVHKEVAEKLKLLPNSPTKEETPTPTFESQLSVLLKDYIADVVYTEVSDQISNSN